MEMKKTLAALTAAAMLATATVPAVLAEAQQEVPAEPAAVTEEVAAPAEETVQTPDEAEAAAHEGDSTEMEDITGLWYGELFGMDLTLDLQADQTFTLSLFDAKVLDGTWTQTPVNMTLKDETTGFEFSMLTEDDHMYNSDYDVSFDRQAPQPDYTAPATVAAADVSDFDGTYEVTRVGINGTYMDFADFLDEDGAVLGVTTNNITIENGQVNAMGIQDLMTFSFTEGRLSSVFFGTEIASVQKNEDGTILVTLMGFQFQAQPVAAEAPQA